MKTILKVLRVVTALSSITYAMEADEEPSEDLSQLNRQVAPLSLEPGHPELQTFLGQYISLFETATTQRKKLKIADDLQSYIRTPEGFDKADELYRKVASQVTELSKLQELSEFLRFRSLVVFAELQTRISHSAPGSSATYG